MEKRVLISVVFPRPDSPEQCIRENLTRVRVAEK